MDIAIPSSRPSRWPFKPWTFPSNSSSNSSSGGNSLVRTQGQESQVHHEPKPRLQPQLQSQPLPQNPRSLQAARMLHHHQRLQNRQLRQKNRYEKQIVVVNLFRISWFAFALLPFQCGRGLSERRAESYAYLWYWGLSNSACWIFKTWDQTLVALPLWVFGYSVGQLIPSWSEFYHRKINLWILYLLASCLGPLTYSCFSGLAWWLLESETDLLRHSQMGKSSLSELGEGPSPLNLRALW